MEWQNTQDSFFIPACYVLHGRIPKALGAENKGKLLFVDVCDCCCMNYSSQCKREREAWEQQEERSAVTSCEAIFQQVQPKVSLGLLWKEGISLWDLMWSSLERLFSSYVYNLLSPCLCLKYVSCTEGRRHLEDTQRMHCPAGMMCSLTALKLCCSESSAWQCYNAVSSQAQLLLFGERAYNVFLTVLACPNCRGGCTGKYPQHGFAASVQGIPTQDGERIMMQMRTGRGVETLNLKRMAELFHVPPPGKSL